MLKNATKLAFLDFSKPFHLWSDTFDVQLGATLVQDGKLLGFYTCKLNTKQHNYSVGERELVDLVDGGKAFDGIICAMNLTIHMDHPNLIYNRVPNQQMT